MLLLYITKLAEERWGKVIIIELNFAWLISTRKYTLQDTSGKEETRKLRENNFWEKPQLFHLLLRSKHIPAARVSINHSLMKEFTVKTSLSSGKNLLLSVTSIEIDKGRIKSCWTYYVPVVLILYLLLYHQQPLLIFCRWRTTQNRGWRELVPTSITLLIRIISPSC